MPKNEIFPYPTVKTVVFQIRFPNLFYIESKIGDFQLEIIEAFPQSSLIIQKPIFLTNSGIKDNSDDKSNEDKESINKIWQFTSTNKCKLNVLSNSVDITSEFHKTYDNKQSADRFRDVIELVVSRFYKIMRIPIITRIGLRYVNQCPLPRKDSTLFKSYYNSAFNLKTYPLENVSEMEFVSVMKKGDYSLRHAESLTTTENETSFFLDFDASAESIKPDTYLPVVDNLHGLINKEFYSVIKTPVLEYMRTPREE